MLGRSVRGNESLCLTFAIRTSVTVWRSARVQMRTRYRSRIVLKLPPWGAQLSINLRPLYRQVRDGTKLVRSTSVMLARVCSPPCAKLTPSSFLDCDGLHGG